MSGATCRGSEHESAGAEWFGARGAKNSLLSAHVHFTEPTSRCCIRMSVVTRDRGNP